MRALVVGASGLVGSALLKALGAGAVGTFRTRRRPNLVELDASDAAAMRALVADVNPEAIFVPAAESNVEWCELHPEEARERNLAPLRSALAAARGRRVIAFSSDYVFDGSEGPYAEDAAPRPLSAYGRIKLELESMLLATEQVVVRTTTVFGYEPDPPKNFALRLVSALRRGEPARVPADQISTPTYADDLAAAVIRLVTTGAGIWHLAGPELMSRVEFARRIASAFELRGDLIEAVRTADLGQVAPRPLRGGLRCPRYEACFGPTGRPIDAALRELRQRVDLS